MDLRTGDFTSTMNLRRTEDIEKLTKRSEIKKNDLKLVYVLKHGYNLICGLKTDNL